VRVLPVPIHVRTHLTTLALAALFRTSQSTVDRVIDHLVAVLAQALRPDPDHHRHTHPWIIDATLTPVHDQSITAISQELSPHRQHLHRHLRLPRPSRGIQPLLT
jgi:hypothetical protein